jgi:uncharacterized protein YijF (DUF1287 family)
VDFVERLEMPGMIKKKTRGSTVLYICHSVLFILISSLCGAVLADTTIQTSNATAISAKQQIGVTVIYDSAYVGLDFPNGDFDRTRGVCTDVVIRALRDAHGFDLQSKVNADMKAHFSSYSNRWGMTRTDKNIDHRRVPNLRRYLRRIGAQLPVSKLASDYQAGDIVSWVLPGNLTHIGVVSDSVSPTGTPLIIHNIGRGAQEEDILFMFEITDHFRLTATMVK